MIIFTTIVLALLWLVAIAGLVMKALDASFDGFPLPACVWGAAAICLFAGPIAVIVNASDADPRLCARGHQEYRTSNGAVLVGKVIVPTKSTRKVWVCDAWEREREQAR